MIEPIISDRLEIISKTPRNCRIKSGTIKRPVIQSTPHNISISAKISGARYLGLYGLLWIAFCSLTMPIMTIKIPMIAETSSLENYFG